MKLCPFCQGQGNHFSLKNGKQTWRTCEVCDGHGTTGTPPGDKFIVMKGFDGSSKTSGTGIEFVSIKECPTKLELALKFNMFKSATQAKKNGWVQPLEVGDIVKVRKSTIVMTE